MPIEKFQINISDEALEDLKIRLNNIRWPQQIANVGWDRGVPKDYLQSLISYWNNHYEWRKQEAALNQYNQCTCAIDGINIHFFHIQSKNPNAIPLILTHGWPDSFLRYTKIIPFLSNPEKYGGKAEDAFNVVIPSLPGFGFSSAANKEGVNNAYVADLWAKLMTEELGYLKFAAAGGDIGSGITRYLAAKYPERLIGIHLTDTGIIRDLLQPTDEKLSDVEKSYGSNARSWIAKEGAYMSIQSTKPHTLSFGLSDSPIAVAAWIIEKLYAWSDCRGNIENVYSKDEIITQVMIYWLTNTLSSSIQYYYENSHSLPPLGKIDVPTGIAIFPKDILTPPQAWVKKNFNIVHWTEMVRGGHFTAMEAPELFAEDLIIFFRPLRRYQTVNCFL